MLPALIPAIPFFSACILMLWWKRLNHISVTVIACGSIALSSLIALIVAATVAGQDQLPLVQHVWQWMQVPGFTAGIDFRMDALSVVFTLVITIVGLLIHVYATGYMQEDEDYGRFFACMNLFVGSMLVLVMADNLLLLYLGWEGVGLCSYLLIGFWYKDPANGYAARKAFIVTRVGDTAMAVALFMLYQYTGTLNIPEILQETGGLWTRGDGVVTLIALLLLGGAVGKSAQLPLQTWLPDAMAGPTPVSALIHAATMVTAGVYLIARMHSVFELAPAAQTATAVIGAVTLVIAGFSALVQTDIKRVLAYSTISQIGYMFLALGCGAWSAAIFHFVTHAFFKALLFMAAGAVIVALHHEQDMFKMGGLRKQLPGVFWVFLIGAASLTAIPFVTAGFYSKDQIIWLSWSAAGGHTAYWLAGLLGALLTGMYTFRMVFLVFYGEVKTKVHRIPGPVMMVPLYILAFLSTVAGFIELPHTLGHVTIFSNWLQPVLPAVEVLHESLAMEWLSQLISAALALGGIWLAWHWVIKKPGGMTEFLSMPGQLWLQGFWRRGWDMDALYDALMVKPFVYFSDINSKDLIDKIYTGLAQLMGWCHNMMARTQSGVLRWYIMGVVLGAVALLSVLIWRLYEI
ncbi:NADH-quinone oxidoreductase subunit L [Chitinophaga sp. HK235]|uniref:NADH-quinone oxidoreductase subunit L n=1 Tax=Chitinophaga sp. HK235 TaxID=2952571 RepID=UPI001BADDA91|nr:NADH-quinone oxidoreductase subunit L [Chitinophaga sp. HK235]